MQLIVFVLRSHLWFEKDSGQNIVLISVSDEGLGFVQLSWQ